MSEIASTTSAGLSTQEGVHDMDVHPSTELTPPMHEVTEAGHVHIEHLDEHLNHNDIHKHLDELYQHIEREASKIAIFYVCILTNS